MMRESNSDVRRPRPVAMDSPPEEDDKDGCDFDFAFNNSNFSDRQLRIRIQSTQSTSERIITLHICSAILAAKSPFFYKLFSNGMIESKQCDATLRINDSEETGLMELLKFMYSNSLKLTSAHAMLDVLIAADKFDVASCLRHCSRLLRNLLTTTPEFVLAYLALPSNILMIEALQPLTIAAKQLCVANYKDIIIKCEDEICSLPLVGVEAIIDSDDLQVTSEYAVYLFVLKWARLHYPKIEERREIMARLAKFIRYPFMTYRELMEVWKSNELEPLFASFVIKEAIAFKDNALDQNYIKNNDSHRFVERRAYKCRPVETRVQVLMIKGLTWLILSTWAVGLTCVIKGLTWVIKKNW